MFTLLGSASDDNDLAIFPFERSHQLLAATRDEKGWEHGNLVRSLASSRAGAERCELGGGRLYEPEGRAEARRRLKPTLHQSWREEVYAAWE